MKILGHIYVEKWANMQFFDFFDNNNSKKNLKKEKKNCCKPAGGTLSDFYINCPRTARK